MLSLGILKRRVSIRFINFYYPKQKRYCIYLKFSSYRFPSQTPLPLLVGYHTSLPQQYGPNINFLILWLFLPIQLNF